MEIIPIGTILLPNWITVSGYTFGTIDHPSLVTLTDSAFSLSGSLMLKEQTAAIVDVGGYGQIWVKDATPCELWFTDDTGADIQLGVGGAGADEKVKIDVGAAAGYIGAAAGDGVLRTSAPLIYTDGGDFVTISLDAGLTNLATVAMAADKFYYTSADNTHVAATVTAFARSILDDANEAAFKATVNLEIGTDVQAHGAVLDDLDTLGSNAADSDFLVGTGAGALAWETGATARTSIGLGTGATPQFAGLNLTTGELTCGSINRAAGTLTLEIGGAAKLSVAGTKTTIEGSLFLKEQAVAIADVASYGQIWVKNEDPCELWFTDDTGTDIQLGVGGAGADEKVKIDVGAVAGYIGAAAGDGVLRTGTSLSYADGGNFVTINAIQNIRTTDSPTFAGLTIADGGTIGQAAGPLLTFDDTNNYLEIMGCDVGIGIAVPVANLHVSLDGVTPHAALLSNVQLIVTGEDTLGFAMIAATNSPTRRAVFKGVRCRGTFAAPTVPLVNDYVCSFMGEMYDGAALQSSATLDFLVDGNVSAGTCPQRMSFSTSETTGLGKVERLTVKSAGNIGINEVNPESILEISHASPYITLHNTTHTDVHEARKSGLIFKGEQSGGEESELGQVLFSHHGSGDDKKAVFAVKVNNGAAMIAQFRVWSHGGVCMYNLKSGINQGAAGAGTNELWVDSDDDNTIKLGT